MKKLSFFAIIMFAFSFLANGQNDIIYEDFAGGTPKLAWTAYNGVYFPNAINSNTGGVNSSVNVGGYKKGPQSYSLFVADLGSPMNLKTNNKFKIQILSPIVSAILMKLEGNSGPVIESIQPITQTNQWVEYTFDFSAAKDYTNLSKIVLFFNPAVTNHEDTYQFDNIVASGSVVNTALPVKYLNFEAKYTEGETILNWKTAQEINNEKFEIEMAGEDQEFRKIGEMPSKSKNSGADYQFLVNNSEITSALNYFRLKQIDNSGKYDYSETIQFLTKHFSKNTEIFPNPASSFLDISGFANENIVSIFRENGTMIKNGVKFLEVGKIDISNLAPGMYILKNMDNLKTKSFIKTSN